MLTGHFATYCLFSEIPAYVRAAQAAPAAPQEFAAALADPEVRRSIVSWTPPSPAVAEAMEKAYGRTYVLGDPPDYEPGPERSLAGLAAAQGVSPLEVAYDEMARDGGTGLLYLPILNYSNGDLDHVYDMLQHPRGLLGLSDGGAHTGTICDGSMPTFMLTHWTRDRARGATLPLEYIVKKQTHDTARLYGMSDRGTVEPGALADFNLIDYDASGARGAVRRQRPARRGPPPAAAGHGVHEDDQEGRRDVRERRAHRGAARPPGARRPLSVARRAGGRPPTR